MNAGIAPEEMLKEVHRAVIGSAKSPGLIHLVRGNSELLEAHKETLDEHEKTLSGKGGDPKKSLVYRMGNVEDVVVWFRRVWWLLMATIAVIALGLPAWLWAVLRSSGG